MQRNVNTRDMPDKGKPVVIVFFPFALLIVVALHDAIWLDGTFWKTWTNWR